MKLRTLILAAVASLAACSSSSSSDDANAMEGSGALEVLVTDAPFMHEIVRSARVRVSEVRVHATHTEDPGWSTVYEGAPLAYDLIELRNGLTRTLVNLTDLPAGRYGRIRLRIADAAIELTNDAVYSTADGTLHLTSTSQSGLQIRIDPPLELEDGASETLLLDFDLSKTFHAVPANDPLAATFFQLHNGVRAVNLSTAGELRGTVRLDSDGSLVEDATIWVLEPGTTDLDDAIASASSDENGSWAVLGLEPGHYDVEAASGLVNDRVEGVGVNVGSATSVDLALD